MAPHRPPPSLNLISAASPARAVSTSPSPSHRQSQSPFRYVKESQSMNEKSPPNETPLSVLSSEKRHAHHPPRIGSSSHHHQSLSPASATNSRGHLSPNPRHHSPFLPTPSPLLTPSHTYTRPRGLRIYNLLKPWIPLICYGITSVGFLVAIAFWKNEVFQGAFLLCT